MTCIPQCLDVIWFSKYQMLWCQFIEMQINILQMKNVTFFNTKGNGPRLLHFVSALLSNSCKIISGKINKHFRERSFSIPCQIIIIKSFPTYFCIYYFENLLQKILCHEYFAILWIKSLPGCGSSKHIFQLQRIWMLHQLYLASKQTTVKTETSWGNWFKIELLHVIDGTQSMVCYGNALNQWWRQSE